MDYVERFAILRSELREGVPGVEGEFWGEVGGVREVGGGDVEAC